MAKKSDSPNQNGPTLQAAISRAEDEVERVKELLASDPKKKGQPLSTSSQVDVLGDQTQHRNTSSQTDRLLSEILNEDRSGAKMSRRHLVIAIIALLVATLGLLFNSNRNAQTVVQELKQNNLEITDPPEGASVGLGQRVRGSTPYTYLNNYVVVTLIRTGSTTIQPALVSSEGTLSAEVRFNDGIGNPAAGEDDEFTLRLLATKETLSAGNLTTLPVDAKLSRQITVRRTKPTEQLAITVPANGAEVSLDDRVEGKTPFTDLTHYVVITPLRVGTQYVQDQPASVTNGSFSGRAKFGGASVGVGEKFTVQIVATKSTLPAGPLAKQPADAIVSNSITVTRKQ
jgi:hypothetical protein